MGVFLMPSLGSDMEAGTLVEWLVAPGDPVHRGDVIAVVETQKGAIEVEIFETGTVARLLLAPGQSVPVGAPMAEIDGQDAAPAFAKPPAPHAPAPLAPASAPRAKAPDGGLPPSSPAARVLARQKGVDLSALKGSGPGGAVLLADVERAGAKGFDPSSMRAAIAAAMARSKREIPHFYLSHDIDLQPATDWLAARNAGRPPEGRLVMGLLLIRAAALAARKHPALNGAYQDGGFRPANGIHPGVAVSLRGGGLIAPALRDADQGSLDDLMEAMRDLVARARSGRLRSSALSDPTLTVSSLGDRGVDALYGVIFPPQVALAGFGSPRPRPMVIAGAIAPRMAVTATLSADHRAADGRIGAAFLADIAARLQTPEDL